jgi:hypothetical protein
MRFKVLASFALKSSASGAGFLLLRRCRLRGEENQQEHHGGTAYGLIHVQSFHVGFFKKYSCADIAGVEGTRYGGIARAFDDRAAVRENGKFVRRHAKTQEEVVAANAGDGFLDAPA